MPGFPSEACRGRARQPDSQPQSSKNCRFRCRRRRTAGRCGVDRARTTRLYPFIVLASATGCRRGELLTLQWPHLNLTTGELSVSKSLEQTKAGLRVKSTKSEKPRHFAVPESPLAVLADNRAEQNNDKRLFGPDYQDHDLIFCQPNGAYYSPDRVGAHVKELMVSVGLEGVSLHALRRKPPLSSPLRPAPTTPSALYSVLQVGSAAASPHSRATNHRRDTSGRPPSPLPQDVPPPG